MRKLNKQDLIFIGTVLIFIVVTFIAYLFITQHFILNNCHYSMAFADWSRAGCFGYFNFFDKVSIYLYTLFLWITIVPYMRKKYFFPNKSIFIGGIAILILVVLYVYIVTPIISLDEYIEKLPKSPWHK